MSRQAAVGCHLLCCREVGDDRQTDGVHAALFDLFETLFTEWRGPADRPPPRWGAPGTDLGVDDEAFRRQWLALQPMRMTSRVSYVEALLLICERLGREPPVPVIHELDTLRCADKASCFDPINDRIVEMLGSLRDLGVRTAIISNCSVEEIEAFERSPLANLVDSVVWSFDVGVAKPDAAIYDVACDRLGVDPANAAFVGDGSFGELDGAANAGLTPLWASWFVSRWPERLSDPRRKAILEAGHHEVSDPLDLVHLARLGYPAASGHSAADD